MTTTVSANRLKKRAKKAAAATAVDQARLARQIQNLFERENWSTTYISESLKMPQSAVIAIIQQPYTTGKADQ